jgi:hypothetical protein
MPSRGSRALSTLIRLHCSPSRLRSRLLSRFPSVLQARDGPGDERGKREPDRAGASAVLGAPGRMAPAGVTLSRAEVLRAAIMRGLGALESKHPRDKATPRELTLVHAVTRRPGMSPKATPKRGSCGSFWWMLDTGTGVS